MKSTDIRQLFLDYFKRQDHQIVASSPLVPANDPTLLFTNAGMVQFKDVFLGSDKRSYKRAVTAQRCLRVGGKHNDLENVGYTARHHTFFEMLGNFSFGDYFKRDAIGFAWELVTRDMGLPPDKLWVTVYEDDDEAADVWLNEIGVPKKHFARMGADSNFWAMGDTGPCGPCSEIFYDHGPEVAGGPPGSPDEHGDRYVEIWNLVFMQFNRDEQGRLDPLPRPSVDTGMGLERIAAVLQGVHSNYDIDLFQHLMQAAAEIAGIEDTDNNSLRVIADHIRACAFLVADGVVPSNEGRGYVLRRIIRRAARHGHELGLREPFFHRLVGPLDKEMGQAYPELPKARKQIERVLKQEETRFAETLELGMKILNEDLANLSGKQLSGETAFKLYDTYGFPLDLTVDYAREHGVTVDIEGYESAMAAQRERARAGSTFKGVAASTKASIGKHVRVILPEGTERIEETRFTGYETTQDKGKVQHIFVGDEQVTSIRAGQDGVIYLDKTPFYAEAGGQVGDQGWLRTKDAVFVVSDTQKLHAHIGRLQEGKIKVGETVYAEVDAGQRQATVYNHSATHLLHAALKKTLGTHVQQKGSLVEAPRLRFDFSHFEPVAAAQLEEIERLVNDEIRANRLADTRLMPLDEALKSGAEALFGEKYDEQVRVVAMGDFSTELCGGTHVVRTGDIGLFKIVSEGGIAAGVRRIEALTGQGALDYVRETEARLQRIAERVKGSPDDAEQKVEQLSQRVRALEKELENLRRQLASGTGVSLEEQAKEIDGIKVLAARLDGADAKGLRETVDRLKDKFGSGAIVLGAADGNKVILVAGVTKDLTKRVHAGKMVNEVASRVGGKGGGRPDMAQAGGNDPSKLDAALANIPAWLETQLNP
ncbi:MAG: alanine--tRNA ligase [Gammaproteobacteria bacterium]|nr:alanine--tRNA ligase [Gammaproteobacteria bacterium]